MSDQTMSAVEDGWDGPVPVGRPNGVPKLLADLTDSLDRLHAKIDTLHQRASMVLQHEQDRASTDTLAVAREARSELSGVLGVLLDRSDSANWRLGEIIERLDL